MSGFVDAIPLAFGLVAGLALALILALVWTIHAGPLAEMFTERFLDRREVSPELTPNVEGDYGIIVSDLHLDTWDFENGKTPAAFAAFLDWVRRHPRIRDLTINGDIMDVPPHPLNQRDVTTLNIRLRGEPTFPDLEGGELGVLQDRFEPILETLGRMMARDNDAPPLQVTYLTGNHDIGISGLRYIRPKIAWTSFKVLWNPSVRYEVSPGRWLYVEHGHRVDPYLWLYLRYASLELIRGPMTSVAQRGGKVGMGAQADVRSDLALDPDAPQSWEGHRGDIPPDPSESRGTRMARYRYRHAARRLFRELDPSVRIVTMGHTHIPDRYTFPGGRQYVNSGDWAGNSSHQSFLVVHPSGRVTGPHQWRNAAEAEALVA